MTAKRFDPNVGDPVLTPRGQGIVLQRVGTASGNGALVFLLRPDNPAAAAHSAPLFDLAELAEGAPLPTYKPLDLVTLPGGYIGNVLAVDGEEVVCSYRTRKPELTRQGRYPRWRLAVSNVCGR